MKVTKDVIKIYVCPTENCGNYYGSSKMIKLEDTMATNIFGKPTHPRSRCPDCGTTRTVRYARLIPEDEQRHAEQHSRLNEMKPIS